MDIYVTAPVGTSGAIELYRQNIDKMEQRFPRFFQAQIEAMASGLCDRNNESEIALAKNNDCIYICTMTEGGLFGALWRGCEELNCGCEVFIDDIPIRQETVEITEITGDNPYEIASVGNLLIFSGDDRSHLQTVFADAFYEEEPGGNAATTPQGAGYHTPVLYRIGKTTAEKERVVIRDGRKRFLTPPARQKSDIASRKTEHHPRGEFFDGGHSAGAE